MENRFTSLILSKKLKEAGCELESKNVYHYVQIDGKEELCFVEKLHDFTACYFPAYDIMNDICIKYCREIFGDSLIQDEDHIKIRDALIDDMAIAEPAYSYHAHRILRLMQHGSTKEVEDYIWNNTVFNPDNKVEE